MAVLAKHVADVFGRQRRLRIFGLRGVGPGDIELGDTGPGGVGPARLGPFSFSLLFTLNGSQVSLLGCGVNLPLCEAMAERPVLHQIVSLLFNRCNHDEPISKAMKKRERAALVLDRLNEHYPEPPIPLDHSDAFTLLIAVLLSAQCTDKKVNEVTPALFEAGPTPEAMAALGEDVILGHIRQLGLAKTKARNVHKLAHILVNVHGSQVPASFEELEALPGVGHKTASVVMAQASVSRPFPSTHTSIGSPSAGD